MDIPYSKSASMKGYLHELCHSIADWFSSLSDGGNNTENYSGPEIVYWNTNHTWILSPYPSGDESFGIPTKRVVNEDFDEEG